MLSNQANRFCSELPSLNNLQNSITILFRFNYHHPRFGGPQGPPRPEARNRSESSQRGTQTDDAVKIQVLIKHMIERALRLDVPEADHSSSDRDDDSQNDETIQDLVSTSPHNSHLLSTYKTDVAGSLT